MGSQIKDTSLAIQTLSMNFHESWRVSLNFLHGLAIVDFLTACWTFIKLQARHRIGLTLEVAGPIPLDSLYFGAATTRTLGDLQH